MRYLYIAEPSLGIDRRLRDCSRSYLILGIANLVRYYFDIRDSNGLVPDEEGLELAELKAAEIEAARSLVGMVKDAAPRIACDH